jgi:hypothetical protein
VQSVQEKSDATFLGFADFTVQPRFLEGTCAQGSSVFLPCESHPDLKYGKLPIHQMILTAN